MVEGRDGNHYIVASLNDDPNGARPQIWELELINIAIDIFLHVAKYLECKGSNLDWIYVWSESKLAMETVTLRSRYTIYEHV